ncbi:Regulator of G-protein signaling 6 [Atta colombica]|uniref:MICOS complex subunit n=1 Tax=Atta colombica TaxID=520822 RepID=A0A195ATE8_9HYME|nr:Regulator of G-protein signaling 6 [Atta colombica]
MNDAIHRILEFTIGNIFGKDITCREPVHHCDEYQPGSLVELGRTIIKFFKKILMPCGLCAIPIVKPTNLSEDKMSPYSKEPGVKKLIRPSDLPIYSFEDDYSKQTLCAERPPSVLEQNISKIRKSVQAVVSEYQHYTNVISDTIDIGFEHCSSLLDYLREESNVMPRMGAIAIGGIAGLVLGLRGRKFKRIMYSSAGALSMAAICYPKKTKEGFDITKHYMNVAYNFIYGVKPGDNRQLQITMPEMPKMQTSFSEFVDSTIVTGSAVATAVGSFAQNAYATLSSNKEKCCVSRRVDMVTMNSEKSACRRKPIEKSSSSSSSKKATEHVDDVDKKNEDDHTNDSPDLSPNTPTYNVTASCAEDTPNYLVYKKMLDEFTGVPVKTVKTFMTKTPSVFTGTDLIAWMMKSMDIDDQEALHVAHLMASHGYFFPIDDHCLTVKSDNTFYRFQTPYFWPSNCWEPENTDYETYLIPGCVNTTELDIKKACRSYKTVIQPSKHLQLGVAGGRISPSAELSATSSIEFLQKEIETLKDRLDKPVIKVSKVAEALIGYFEQYMEYDPFFIQPELTNPWISDSPEMWEPEKLAKEISTRRVKRWAFSLQELLQDSVGREQFIRFLDKEFSGENLKFWETVQELKTLPQKDVQMKVEEIWREFLDTDASCPINVDSQSYEITKKSFEKPDRWCFDVAAAHVYHLMKSDSYSRYLRSEMYKDFLNGSKKKTSVKGIRSIVSFTGRRDTTTS